jgi:hypothetical protein
MSDEKGPTHEPDSSLITDGFSAFTHHSSLITFHWLLWLNIKKDFYLQHLIR